MTIGEIKQLAGTIRTTNRDRDFVWGYDGNLFGVRLQYDNDGDVELRLTAPVSMNKYCVQLSFQDDFRSGDIDDLMFNVSHPDLDCPGWTRKGYGRTLMTLILRLFKELGVRESSLVDVAAKAITPWFDVNFTDYLALTQGTSFYGKYGYVYRDLHVEGYDAAVRNTESWLNAVNTFATQSPRVLLTDDSGLSPEDLRTVRAYAARGNGVSDIERQMGQLDARDRPIKGNKVIAIRLAFNTYHKHKAIKQLLKINPDITIRELTVLVVREIEGAYERPDYQDTLVQIYNTIRNKMPDKTGIRMVRQF